jgi:hypothetical protein
MASTIGSMTCPLCGRRKARRACPAIGHHICAVCCGTKRLTEILCPPDCGYLALAREHPPAVAVRERQRDIGLVVQLVRDFNERQSRLFLLTCSFLAQYASPELQPLIDDDVAEAVAALAATLETASRGVIYEHRPASLPAERLLGGLKTLLADRGDGSSAFDRDAAAMLRRVEEAVSEARANEPANTRALLDLLGRVVGKGIGKDVGGNGEAPGPPAAEAPRLIVP